MMTNSAKANQDISKKSSPKRTLQLYEQALIALVLGIVAGLFLGEFASIFKVVGDIFIKLLQITVIPYISLSLITGLGSLGFDTVKRLALKGGSILLGLWSIAVLIVLLTPLAFPNWPSSSFFSIDQVETSIAPDFLRLFIPSNPFYSYANAIVPAVVVFSILVGIALIGVKEKYAIIDPLSALLKALIKVLGIITKLTPIGVFALIANIVGTIEISELMRLQVFIILYAMNALVLSLWILPALISTLTPLKFSEVSRALRTPLVTGFATGSGLIVVPMLIEQSKKLIAEAKVVEHERQEYTESLPEILIPTVYPFPSAGVVLTLTFILFSGWYVGSGISPTSYPTLIAVGIPSLFAGTLISMPFILDFMKLPSDMYQVFVSIDVITVRFATLVSVMHYASIGLIGTMAMVGKLHFHYFKLLKFTMFSILILSIVIVCVNTFYSYVVVAPYTMDEALKRVSLQGATQPAIIYNEASADLVINQNPASFSEILQRGVLRVCYQPNEYPSAFYNNAIKPQLVGFDIEMAHRLAHRRHLTLEFFPASNEDDAANKLNTGVCDIYMRSLPISEGRTQMFGMTNPIYTSAVGLVVKDHRRDEFRNWKTLSTNNNLNIALEASEEGISLLRNILPNATLVPIDMAAHKEMFASGAEGIDAIADMAEEGAAWTVLFPNFNLVVPRPIVSIPVAYAVARGNSDLLEALNAWLITEKAQGNVDSLYRYWMLGEAIKVESPARWSIIRDVLGWVD